ncbi:bifunctional diguanylate cyclase/phosphodiesterase [uncultured Neptuniibacter sp.]|uniref:putative bifunctional diguanylate cyclase/phosphodiesterase n=1 Tax=uncultured Neptuniibacter sp. TaxID=502143 RepID=UPI002618EA98|nr:GGDEF domain-containing phosphodiesterase [uncultured Neptuniibacter sp.]
MNKQQNIPENTIPFDWLKGSSIGVLELDADYHCVYANPAAASLIWEQPYAPLPLLPHVFKEALLPHLTRLNSSSSSSLSQQLVIPQTATEELLLSIEISKVTRETSPHLYFITIRNSSHSARQARELKVFRNAVENTGSAVVITDARGQIEYANHRFSEITGYEIADVRGKSPGFLSSGNTSKETYDSLWSTILNNQQWRGTLLNRRKDGTTYWSLQNISPIHDEQGNIINFVSVSEDISQIKEHDAMMEKMAYYDPLTELGNRRNFRRALDQHLQDTPEEGYSALLLLDLDHFKQINDTMGHEAGDALLTTIAGRLNFCTRNRTSVFRLGGDEFTLIFHNCMEKQQIIERANEVLNLLSQPLQIGAHEIRVTVSIGITLIGVDSLDASDLLRNADLAMYYAKKQGRNTFAFYEERMDAEAQRTLSIEHDLRHALNTDQLRVVYQSQINAKTSRITAMEALLRWDHPLDGEIPPAEFIPHAEETGLIIPIGHWVMKEACKAAKSIQLEGLPPVKVCVNLSARQFDDPSLISHIEEALSESQLDPQWLELEITESMLMRDISTAIETLNKIKARNISLAIDDFGTGYSSLSHLKKMPVDRLKIDRSFLMDIPEDKDNMAITTTIIAMTKMLGLKVVAEGVENHDQMQFLNDNDCSMMQGYLINRPERFDDFQQKYRYCQRFCGHCHERLHCTFGTA